jgi:hypothetical protein
MTEIYSVVAAFGTNTDAKKAAQTLERSGLPITSMFIEGRVSPLVPKYSLQDAVSDWTSWTITGALSGGLWALLGNRRPVAKEKETIVSTERLVSCLGSVLQGACVFAGMSFVALSMTKSGLPSLCLMEEVPTLSVDPYLLVIQGTPAAVTLAGDILKTGLRF